MDVHVPGKSARPLLGARPTDPRPQPETGNRSFEENQAFFRAAKEDGTWRVARAAEGEYRRLPGVVNEATGEQEPLLRRVREQL